VCEEGASVREDRTQEVRMSGPRLGFCFRKLPGFLCDLRSSVGSEPLNSTHQRTLRNPTVFDNKTPSAVHS
jgi:hypothetical protein